jgi:DNA-binding NarL/FixJ family response regulator
VLDIAIYHHNLEFCKGMKHYLHTQKGFLVSGIVDRIWDVMKLLRNHKPNVLMLDFSVRDDKSAQRVQQFLQRYPNTKVVVVAEELTDAQIELILGIGITGCLLRSTVMEEAGPVLKNVANGGIYFSEPFAQKAVEILARKLTEGNLGNPANVANKNNKKHSIYDNNVAMTKRETMVAVLIGKGLSYIEIAKRLELAEGTVRNYVCSILKKTGFHNRSQIAIYARQQCLPELSQLMQKQGTQSTPTDPLGDTLIN